MKKILAFALFLTSCNLVNAQKENTWNGKSCAVVLTYDDAIDIDLDHVVPALDSAGLKGTFYLIGSSPVVARRINEWRKIASEGYELGNHSLFHPCDGTKPGRTFVKPETDLSKYTVYRAVAEIRQNNVLLHAIDGKNERTFAYPCADLTINGVPFYPKLKNEFVAARGVHGNLDSIHQVNLDDMDCYSMNNQTGEYMISLVKKAMETHTLLVFLFHGVGGGHSINVTMGEHSKLIHFLQEHEKEIWVAPMLTVAQFIKKSQSGK